MAEIETDRILEMLRDPNVESREVAAAAGVPREEAARAARLVVGIATADPGEVATLPPPLAGAVCRAALAAARSDLLAALAGHAGKHVAKEAKRALHILKARGVAVPEPPRPAAPSAAPPPEPPLAAYATAIDGRGERAVWIPRSVPGKGIEVAQAILSDERGLIELQLGVVGRKEWRAIAKDLAERGAAMGLGEIERGRATALVAAARALNDRSGHPVPQRADPWLQQLGPATPLPDPAAVVPPLPPDEEREALAASGRLHELPLFLGWYPEEEFLRELAAKLDEIAVSALYIDDAQRNAQISRTLEDAVERYFDAECRARISARLFSVAEHFAAHGASADAHAAAAVARALASGAAPRAIPFAMRLVEKAFPAPAEGAHVGSPEQRESGSALIVGPR